MLQYVSSSSNKCHYCPNCSYIICKLFFTVFFFIYMFYLVNKGNRSHTDFWWTTIYLGCKQALIIYLPHLAWTKRGSESALAVPGVVLMWPMPCPSYILRSGRDPPLLSLLHTMTYPFSPQCVSVSECKSVRESRRSHTHWPAARPNLLMPVTMRFDWGLERTA